jgi:hypothetical protein
MCIQVTGGHFAPFSYYNLTVNNIILKVVGSIPDEVNF